MKKVYILTEDGSGYSDKGIEYITNHLVDNLEETEDLEFVGGAIVNDPEFLAKELEANPTCFVAISQPPHRIEFISGRNIKVLRDALIANSNDTSWNTSRKAEYYGEI